MNEAEYCRYMRRFADEWRVRRGEDGVYCMVGKYAVIVPNDYGPEYFLVVCDFPSMRFKNKRLKKVYDVFGFNPEITQEGDADVVFKVKNDDVNTTWELLKPVLGLYVRKRYPNRKLSGIALKRSLEHKRGGE